MTYACNYRILSLPKARLYSHLAHGTLQYVLRCVTSSEPATIFYCKGATVQVSFPKNNADKKTLMCEERALPSRTCDSFRNTAIFSPVRRYQRDAESSPGPGDGGDSQDERRAGVACKTDASLTTQPGNQILISLIKICRWKINEPDQIQCRVALTRSGRQRVLPCQDSKPCLGDWSFRSP